MRLLERLILSMKKDGAPHSLKTVQILNDDNIKTGDQVEIDGNKLMEFRDQPFIYMNGELIIGKDRNATHEDLILRIIEDNDLADELLSSRFGMENDVSKIDANMKFAAGYIFGDAAILLESSVEGCSSSEVISILNNKFSKVYITQEDSLTDVTLKCVSSD